MSRRAQVDQWHKTGREAVITGNAAPGQTRQRICLDFFQRGGQRTRRPSGRRYGDAFAADLFQRGSAADGAQVLVQRIGAEKQFQQRDIDFVRQRLRRIALGGMHDQEEAAALCKHGVARRQALDAMIAHQLDAFGIAPQGVAARQHRREIEIIDRPRRIEFRLIAYGKDGIAAHGDTLSLALCESCSAVLSSVLSACRR